MQTQDQSLQSATTILQRGGIGVLPTDTLYGLVGQALTPAAVARIYQLRRRNPSKPSIILISSLDDLKLFGIPLSPQQHSQLANFWPGPVSVILNLPAPAQEKFKYLHCGTGTLAFRLPASNSLQELLRATGPLIAPSANPEGLPPAETVEEARAYFGTGADFYLSAGRLPGQASTLIRLAPSGEFTVIHPGVASLTRPPSPPRPSQDPGR